MEKSVQEFFKEDVYTSVEHQADVNSARMLQSIRMNSRGNPHRRTILGTEEDFNPVKSARQKHALEKLHHKMVKASPMKRLSSLQQHKAVRANSSNMGLDHLLLMNQ